MKFSEFSEANRARCESPSGFNHRLQGWSLSDWMTATLGELGEAANIAKKLNRVRDGIPGNKETEVELRVDLLAQSAGFTIEEAARDVFNRKSADIGYPVTL